MPLVLLVLLIIAMLITVMLTSLNPEPIQFRVSLFGYRAVVQAALMELIGGSVAIGGVLVGVGYLREAWLHRGERKRLERQARELSEQATAAQREAENARSDAKLLEARLAEAEERYAALEAESRPLLTMRREALPPPEAEPAPDPQSKPPTAAPPGPRVVVHGKQPGKQPGKRRRSR